MMRRTSQELIRTTAKLVFGSFLFLFVASFLVMPCMQADSGLFVSFTNGSSAALSAARSSSAVKAFPPASLQGPLSKVALGTPLLVTLMPGATAPTASMQFASAWRASSALAVSAEVLPSPHVVYRQPFAAASCVEQKLFKPRMNVFKAFEVPTAEHPLRFVALLAVVLGFGISASFFYRTPIRARPGWTRLRSLPFASSEPPRLACFAAQRDA
jgi:hypothetical protein